MSYGAIADLLNTEFKDEPRKSRNATLGRATRKGYVTDKPSSGLRNGNSSNKRKRKVGTIDKRRSMKRVKSSREVVLTEQPVVFALREEGETGVMPPRSARLKQGSVELDKRRKGNLPCIVELAPLTSHPVAEVERGGCMWPTSDSIECMEVCGVEAVVGAYCARHAQVAFRIMPTKKRNRVRDKEDREHLVRVDGSHLRGESDADGEWLSRQLMALEEITVDADGDGIAPLLLPHFIGVFNE
jgi:hypothetical protein